MRGLFHVRKENMARNRASAKAAGSRFERQVADYLAENVDDRIDRKVKTGSRDEGDIGGLRHMGQKVCVEVKNTSRINLGVWANEVELQRGHYDAGAGLIVHKRHGKGQPGEQWVTMTLDDFIALLTGQPKELE